MPFTIFAQQLFGRKIFWIRLQKLKSSLFYIDINVFMTVGDPASAGGLD